MDHDLDYELSKTAGDDKEIEYYDDEYGSAVEESLQELKEQFGEDFSNFDEETKRGPKQTREVDLPETVDVQV